MKLQGASACLLLTLLPVLVGCDPGVDIAWEKDFQQAVDTGCLERSLRNVVPEVRRGSYVSDGHDARGFPSGTEVTQFAYSDPTLIGYYNLDVATLPNGTTHYWHGWGKLGRHVPDEERALVTPLLARANEVVARECGLSFAGAGPR